MSNDLSQNIIKVIASVPGLIGLADVDFSQSPTALVEKDWIKGISFDETPQGILVRVGIIVVSSIRSKVIAYEIDSAIKGVFKKHGRKLYKVIVYIRGIE